MAGERMENFASILRPEVNKDSSVQDDSRFLVEKYGDIDIEKPNEEKVLRATRDSATMASKVYVSPEGQRNN